MSATVSISAKSNALILSVKGGLTGEGGVAVLETYINKLILDGEKNFIINLAEVTRFDSSGIKVLMEGFTNVSNAGGSLKLLAVTKRIEDLLRMTKMYSVFEVFTDKAAAVASFDK